MDPKKLYISDLHLGHKGVLRLDRRPFADLEEMTETIVERWNGAVRPQDHVYLLGDIMWKGNEENQNILRRLNGNLHLIIGNHDKWAKDKRHIKIFRSVEHFSEIKDGDYKVTLSHIPMPWFRSHRHPGAVHLYGHVHMTEEFKEVLIAQKRLMDNEMTRSRGQAFNVGAMLPYMDYTPRTLEEILVAGRRFNEEFYKNEDFFSSTVRKGGSDE